MRDETPRRCRPCRPDAERHAEHGECLLVTTALHAEESAADKAAAAALFDEGRKLMSAGNVDAACPKFKESSANPRR